MKRPIVFVAGHRGMVGSAIVRALQARDDCEILTRTRDELDLCNQHLVDNFFATNSIDKVYLAAAKVGGIVANNNFPADFILENLQIQNNVIGAANKHGVEKLLFLGSSCIYPKLSPQPIKEEYLLTGLLEPTNEPYAIAKISGIKLCESINRQYGRQYRSLMPTNLYGPGDNYHPTNSHVIPALIRKIHEAKTSEKTDVVVWGTGAPRREFLHVDDIAQAAITLMQLSNDDFTKLTGSNCNHINAGAGFDLTIAELVDLIASVINYEGKIVFDNSFPDGTPKKLLDSSKLTSLGWRPTIDLKSGILSTYNDFLRKYT